MCSLKYSKSIIPFAITFIVGLFFANLFFGFASANTTVKSEVSEVKVYETTKKKKRCRKNKRVYSVETFEEKRIISPSFEQTIIINEEVKQIRR